MPDTESDEIAGVRAATRRLGLKELRPGQEVAIEAILAGRDALAVMATGYGKSAIYQVAGQLIDGPTLVVSPLIALQHDQVESLDGTEAGGAAAVSSNVSETERREALEGAAADEVEFLFMAPEQLANPEVLERVRDAAPSLMVVDEAHCISEWGHDFRPDYLKLGEVAERVGRPPILALTATASPPVRDEIAERLGLDDPLVEVRGFDRPNLWLGVERFHDEKSKLDALAERVTAEMKPGIVYGATRKGVEETASRLSEAGIEADFYHGGLARGRREELHRRFMDGEVEVMVATTAFGMGIDKPDVRFVFHQEVADSVDSYYQEIGRAGRDGEPARAILFYRPEDLGIRRFFAGSGGGSDDETDDPETREQRERFDQSRVEMMRGYAEFRRGCRREFLLSYFGEPYEGPCGSCDNDDEGRSAEEGDRPFAMGSEVEHAEWGGGQVMRYDGDRIVVLFETVGYKTLGLDLVTGNDLLREPAGRD